MRVAFDASSIGSGLGGDETMARGLVRALVRGARPDDHLDLLLADAAQVRLGAGAGAGAGADDEVDRALLGEDVDGQVRVASAPRSGGPRHFLWDLPRWVRSLTPPPDVVISLTHAPVGSGVPVALMVPDLSFEHLGDAFPRSTRLRLQTMVRRQAPRAAAVLTISDFCRADLIDTYRLPEDRVHHVPLHVDPPAAAPTPAQLIDQRQRLAINGPFVLYLGNLHPRKNLPSAIEAFQLARRRYPELAGHRFVVAGATWWWSDSGDTAPPDQGDAAGVQFLGRVSDDDRHLLLHAADALIYPSRFEGFGLPPLEAMARGTPVVASNVTSIPEVCGDAALLAGPDDVSAMADALAAALTDEPVRSRLIEAGHRRARHYDVDRTTDRLWAALRTMAPEGAAAGTAVA